MRTKIEHTQAWRKGKFMATQSSAAKAVAEFGLAPTMAVEDIAATLVAAHDGDALAAVVALVGIVQSLKDENRILRGAASPGFARRRPLIFGASS
jgi:hypothetical protein